MEYPILPNKSQDPRPPGAQCTSSRRRAVMLMAFGAVALLAIGTALYHAQAAEGESPASAGEKAQAWDQIETVGEEDEWVETVYDDGKWIIIGERGIGIPWYDVEPYQIPIRKWEDIPMYPCSDCHDKWPVNHEQRPMVEEHTDLVVDHGDGHFWCTGCHDGRGLDFLVSKDGRFIDMDLSYIQCGECHFEELKDWEYGSHGLRIGLWRGTRVLRNCVECHNAHSPAIAPIEPNAPPKIRGNLVRFSKPAVEHSEHSKVWERVAPKNN